MTVEPTSTGLPVRRHWRPSAQSSDARATTVAWLHRPRRKHGIGTDAAMIANDRAELLAAGSMQDFSQAHQDFLVLTLVSVIVENAARLQVDICAEDGVADEVEVSKLGT